MESNNTKAVNANGNRYLIKRLPATNEYVVRVFDGNGRRNPARDYYTTDKDDAVGTRNAMVEEDSKKPKRRIVTPQLPPASPTRCWGETD